MVENSHKETFVKIMENPSNHNQSIDNRLNYPSNNSSGSQVCCLMDEGIRCHRLSGNACCSKPIQRKMMMQRKLRLSLDESARHIYICDHHKNIIQNMRSISKRKKKDDDDDNNSVDDYSFNSNFNSYEYDDLPVVDLSGLQVNTLRRYKRHYRVSAKPGLNKSQLVECLENHFQTIPVIEKEAITYFIYMVKTNKNKLDQNKSINSNQP